MYYRAHYVLQRAVQSSVVALVTACAYLGAALASALSPPLIAAYGWPAVFYGFGAVGFLWLPPWIMLAPNGGKGGGNGAGDGGASGGSGNDSRSSDAGGSGVEPEGARGRASALAPIGPCASSDHEMSPNRLEPVDCAHASGVVGRTQNFCSGALSLAAGLPWHLLRRREVWAICAAQYGGNWGFYCLLNWLPTYLRCAKMGHSIVDA